MKIFFISLVIFLAMSGGIFFNSLYINETAERLEEITQKINTNSDGIDELEALWDKNMEIIEFSVNHSLVNAIGIRIKNIRHYIDEGMDESLARETMLLMEDLKELKRLDEFLVHNIF